MLDKRGRSSELPGMTSSGFPATWLTAAIARAAVVPGFPAQTVPTGGRHTAPEIPGMFSIAAPEEVGRSGRHAEPEWSRELFDPERDEIDPLTWLGFAEQH